MRQVVTRHEGEARVSREPSETWRAGFASRAIATLLRKYTARNERLQVCETISLGGKRSVALIECDGQRFLAGMSAAGVETLVAVPENPRLRGELR